MTTPECRICNADTSNQKVRAKHVYGGKPEHAFWHCDACGVIHLYPVPSIAQEKEFYKNEFEGFMGQRSASDRDWSSIQKHRDSNQDNVLRRWEFIKNHFKSGDSILEVGCSSGFMLDFLKNKGSICEGIEPSGYFSDYLRNKGYTIYDDFSDLASHKKYDLIIHFFVFEHIRDPYKFIRDTLASLKPGGVSIAEIPCALDPLTELYQIDEFEKFYWSIAHHYYYTPKSLRYILEKLGCRYEIVPEQRYDLSNHITWLQDGRPGGQGRISDFSDSLNDEYKRCLKDAWKCDTMFLYIYA